MTTYLRGTKTFFLPFNKGFEGGAGNPPLLDDHATSYLWNDVWTKDSVLNLIDRFCADYTEQVEDGTRQRVVIFPRYHQREAVQKLIAHTREHGPGQRYLIQHSAGSGKSNTIAWLALQLSTLHGDDDRRVFDSIIVVTDRRILDRQLQNTLGNFITTQGVLENIDKTSRQLKEALEHGKTVIVTTLQKFPVILDEVGELPAKKFAVIVDEAHSSQSGEGARQMKGVLAGNSNDDEADEDVAADEIEDLILEDISRHGPQPNLSMFAFTSTPKEKTLEMFGVKQADGSFRAFSLYTMRQAIEERFILDVLENYTTYEVYFHLLKKIEDDPEFDRDKAKYLLKQFVDFETRTIDKKVAIMIEHFVTNTMPRIGDRAKAMIVTPSRLAAVRYRLAVDKYLEEHDYPFKALVAFSDEIKDGGKTYSEANMNGFPERQTAERHCQSKLA